MEFLILGGGGIKTVEAWQDDPVLSKAANWMIEVSDDILDRLQSGEIKWVDGNKKLNGDLKFNQDDE